MDMNEAHYIGAVTCPLNPGDYDYLILLSGQLLDSPAGRQVVGPFAAAVPAGNYEVTLVSADFGAGHGTQGQEFEQYFVRLYDRDPSDPNAAPPTDPAGSMRPALASRASPGAARPAS